MRHMDLKTQHKYVEQHSLSDDEAEKLATFAVEKSRDDRQKIGLLKLGSDGEYCWDVVLSSDGNIDGYDRLMFLYIDSEDPDEIRERYRRRKKRTLDNLNISHGL